MMPDEAEAGTPLYLMLDDIAGASLGCRIRILPLGAARTVARGHGECPARQDEGHLHGVPAGLESLDAGRLVQVESPGTNGRTTLALAEMAEMADTMPYVLAEMAGFIMHPDLIAKDHPCHRDQRLGSRIRLKALLPVKGSIELGQFLPGTVTAVEGRRGLTTVDVPTGIGVELFLNRNMAPLDETYNYDPEKAKQLLAEAGHPNGIDLGEVILVNVITPGVADVLQDGGVFRYRRSGCSNDDKQGGPWALHQSCGTDTSDART
ncbi:MAG: hypothetical protein WAW17_02120, partial [Rhodococcus sp. (in: high G+C Gram-positive bacteria)]